MRPNPLRSMRSRLAMFFTLSTAFVMLITCTGVMWFSRYSAESSAKEQLTLTAHRIQSEMNNGERPVDPAQLMSEERDLRADNVVLIIVKPTGEVIEKSQNRIPVWPKVDNDLWRVKSVPYGAYFAVVAIPWDQTELSLRRQAYSLIGTGIIVVLLGAIGTWLMVGKTLSPIRNLANQARTISPASPEFHLAPPSDDVEVVELVGTLNELLARQSEIGLAKARFYAAASHELRTPLQALSGHLELSLSRDRTSAERLETVTEAYEQTRRIKDLVRDILTLNRHDFAETKPIAEVVVVAEIVSRMRKQFQELAAGRSLEIETVFEHDFVTLAFPSHLEILVRNLVENALCNATIGGKVKIVLADQALTISNDYPNETLLDGARLFEPFFRPDTSRTSETGGNGLGLAICKTIAVDNGWELHFAQSRTAVIFTVSFA